MMMIGKMTEANRKGVAEEKVKVEERKVMVVTTINKTKVGPRSRSGD